MWLLLYELVCKSMQANFRSLSSTTVDTLNFCCHILLPSRTGRYTKFWMAFTEFLQFRCYIRDRFLLVIEL